MRDLEGITTAFAAAGTTVKHRDSWPPVGAPLDLHRDESWRSHSFNNSVNAVSFGFVATAILILMFLVMAIFERLIRPTASDSAQTRLRPGMDSRVGFSVAMLDYHSPKMALYSKGVSVLMPGDEIPTFIAHPAPVPCPPERLPRPNHHHHHHHSLSRDPTRISNSNTIQDC